MRHTRLFQLSLRGMFVLTAAAAAGLGLGLDWLGRLTPPEGETLVTAAEQEVLAAMRAEFKLVYSDGNSHHFAVT